MEPVPHAGSHAGAACPGTSPAARRAAASAAALWQVLGGDPAQGARVRRRLGPPPAARLPMGDLARATVEVCALAAAEFHAPGARVRVEDEAVAAAFVSERLLRVDGRPVVAFAPLSRFWRTADGWVRTHANYPHHRARLLAALGVADPGEDGAAAEALAAALAGRSASGVEESVYAAGGLAVAVRSREAWLGHPQGAAVAARPLLVRERLDDAPPASGERLRVLDLTRVIAGPVATRTLALLGADVLRVDAPRLPELPEAHADTGFGKRSTRLDLSARRDQAVFEDLLARAHVVVVGYRPGALHRYGLSAVELARRRPGLVVAELSAWGDLGPWGTRRGFDSLVQAASGIALAEAGADGRPGALPAQALDHGTGYLLAAAVLRALSEQRAGRPGGARLRLSLAGTAHWLLTAPPGAPAPADGTASAADGTASRLLERDSPLGRLRYVRPPLEYDGGPVDWTAPPGRLGGDAPRWRVS